MLQTGSWDKTARITNLENGKIKHIFKHYHKVLSVSFSNDGKLLATGSWDNTARIIDVKTGIIKKMI